MITYPPKIPLARIPTPMEPLLRLSREWQVDLRVKRDDLTGADLSGNKIRKLEYLLADAQNQSCDSIITCGAVTSNHTRATTIAARRLGMDTTLVLAGDPPAAATGNLQLELLAGARVKYISWQDFTLNRDRILQDLGEDLKRQGKKPYLIPSGGSNPMGMIGYIEAVEEISRQCQELAWKPDVIVCAVGSGGTYAGLFLGNALFPIATQVVGVIVCNTVEYFTRKIWGDVTGAMKLLGESPSVSDRNITLIDGYIAGGYAQTNSEQLQFYRYVAQEEGLILEPVYTGKTFFGLYQEIRKGTFPQGSRILFIHTGGIYGLAAFSEAMTREWQSTEHWDVS